MPGPWPMPPDPRPQRNLRIWFRVEEEVKDRHGVSRRRLLQRKLLQAGKITKMNPISVNVGQTAYFGFLEYDQNGHPMATPVAGTAAWSNASAGTGTITPSATGQSASYVGVAAGTDTVTLVLTVGSQTFTATAAITVVAVAQVLTSIQLVQLSSPGP
jgi:hypothetical protein